MSRAKRVREEREPAPTVTGMRHPHASPRLTNGFSLQTTGTACIIILAYRRAEDTHDHVDDYRSA